MEYIKKRVAEKFPQLKLATIRPSDDDRDKAFTETQTILKVPSEREVDCRYFGAGGAGFGGGCPAGGPEGCFGDRAFAAEFVQAVCARRCGAGGGAVEYEGSGVSDGLHGGRYW